MTESTKQNGKKYPVQTDKNEQDWSDSVGEFIELANRIQFEKEVDVRLVSTALMFAAIHYNIYEITEGGTLPKDITGLASNKAYAAVVDLVKTNVNHLVPPDRLH